MTCLLGEILEGQSLSDRETEILAGAAEGETAEETGARLFLSSETVKGYRKRVDRETRRTERHSRCSARDPVGLLLEERRGGAPRFQAEAANAASTSSSRASTLIQAGRGS